MGISLTISGPYIAICALPGPHMPQIVIGNQGPRR